MAPGSLTRTLEIEELRERGEGGVGVLIGAFGGVCDGAVAGVGKFTFSSCACFAGGDVDCGCF